MRSGDGTAKKKAPFVKLRKNMDDVVLIIHRDDIGLAKVLVQKFTSYRTFVFDPVLVDEVEAGGFQGIEALVWKDAPAYIDLYNLAHKSADALEAELDLVIRDLLPEISIRSWQHLRWYYFFNITQWYSSLWREVSPRLENYKLHVFVNQQPLLYYFNSFVPASLLVQVADSCNLKVTSYNYGKKEAVGNVVPDLSGVAVEEDRDFLLIHIPTCFYDIGHFNKEFELSQKARVNISSPLFDLPVSAHRNITLAPMERVQGLPSEWIRNIVIPFAQRINAVLSARIPEILKCPLYAAEQIDYACAHYVSQLFTFLKLQTHFGTAKPSKIVISDHDTGFHGPLVSFAQLHHIPVVTLPHSKVSYDVRYAYENISSLTHCIQGDEIQNSEGVIVRHFPISYPTQEPAPLISPRKLEKIGILLNGISVNGVHFCTYRAYVQGLRQLLDWCSLHNVEVEIRGKPTYTMSYLLRKELALEEAIIPSPFLKSLSDFVKGCDVCLMYDAPTSAALEILAQCVPILNPLTVELTKSQSVGTSHFLVPRESIEQTLEHLTQFKQNAESLTEFVQEQQAKFTQLLETAKPLSSYL